MSKNIIVYKISRPSIEQLHFDLPDFDSVTALLPSGLYTTFRTYAEKTKVIGLRAHLDRLYLPAQAQRIVPAVPQEELRERLAGLLTGYASGEARLRLILDTSKEPGELYVLLQELPVWPSEIYRDGVRLDVCGVSREKPTLKQTTFIGESAAERKLLGGDVFEILLTHNGRILEGLTSNFFYVRDDVLHTAARGVLPGITRQTIITIAKRAGIPVRYKALALREIPEIEDAFITSSSRGMIPVVQITDHLVGNGKVGAVTKQLMDLYERKVLELAEPIL